MPSHHPAHESHRDSDLTPDAHGAHSSALRDRGLRVTASRLAVLRLLETSAAPLTHQEVVDYFKDSPWNRSTLYRNLVDLTEVGLLTKSEIGGLMRFERAGRDNACTEHPHFVCTDCGTVTHLDTVTVHIQGTGPQAVAEGRIEVQLRGRCDACN
jgi:Fur family ferric uptake transcriptional regulator